MCYLLGKNVSGNYRPGLKVYLEVGQSPGRALEWSGLGPGVGWGRSEGQKGVDES